MNSYIKCSSDSISRTQRREIVISLHKAGHTVCEILQQVDIPRNSARRILRREGLVETIEDFKPKAVWQYKDGALVARYSSILEAEAQTGLNREGIRRSVHGIRKTFKGFKFYDKPQSNNWE